MLEFQAGSHGSSVYASAQGKRKKNVSVTC